MGHAFMLNVSKSLAENKIGTVRFNFPYMENKKGRPDVPAVAEKTIESVLNEVRGLYPETNLLMIAITLGSDFLLRTKPIMEKARNGQYTLSRANHRAWANTRTRPPERHR